MYFLIYTSSAIRLMGDGDLMELLDLCRKRNAKDGISGMLLYKEGSFMQALEGEKEKVKRTFERIQRDPRHKDIFLLRERDVESRCFDGWSMGFKSVVASDLERRPSFAYMSDKLFSSPTFNAKPHIAMKLLQSFHENTR